MRGQRGAMGLLAGAVAAMVLGATSYEEVVAQNRMAYSVVSPDSGHIALGLAIRKLNVSGTFMQSAAHPDDEHLSLIHI